MESDIMSAKKTAIMTTVFIGLVKDLSPNNAPEIVQTIKKKNEKGRIT
jgi:hypothetical protein